jgi:hypothetical protein
MRAAVSISVLIATIVPMGCSITQQVDPLPPTPGGLVCIVRNPDVKEGFLDQFESTLRRRGYESRAVPAGTPVTHCTVTSTYDARWSWDLALYMIYARISVYLDGEERGEALYDARRGTGRIFEKFIDAEEKVDELVSELFPRRP